jgi:uncharacterized membrane protein
VKTAIGIVAVVCVVLYPAAVYFGIRHGQMRLVGLLLLCAALLRTLTGDRSNKTLAATSILAALFAVGIAVTQSESLARFYPVVVNLVLLAAFALSIVWPPAVVTRLALARGAPAHDHVIRYTRRVTGIWCAFFIANGCIAFYTAMFATREIWALYNGFIAYILAGALMFIEWMVRPTVDRNERA